MKALLRPRADVDAAEIERIGTALLDCMKPLASNRLRLCDANVLALQRNVEDCREALKRAAADFARNETEAGIHRANDLRNDLDEAAEQVRLAKADRTAVLQAAGKAVADGARPHILVLLAIIASLLDRAEQASGLLAKVEYDLRQRGIEAPAEIAVGRDLIVAIRLAKNATARRALS